MKTIYRYTVPVDGKPHLFGLTSMPLSVANGRTLDEVEFWAEHDDEAQEIIVPMIVIGTGHPLPDGGVYVGTCPRTREGLVWHLYRIEPRDEAS